MEVDILYRPAAALGVIRLQPGEQALVESASLVSMSEGIEIQTQASGGIFKSLSRKVFGGESFWQNVYTAPASGGELCVGAKLPGDMFCTEVQNESLLIQSGSYVASEADIVLDTKWGGAKTFFASEGLIMLQAIGSGKVLLSSYGAIHEKVLKEGETYTVNTGHLVAFDQSLGFKVRSVGGVKSFFLSGEGLVVDLTGPGRVFMQTRSTDAFISWLLPQIPKPTT